MYVPAFKLARIFTQNRLIVNVKILHLLKVKVCFYSSRNSVLSIFRFFIYLRIYKSLP